MLSIGTYLKIPINMNVLDPIVIICKKRLLYYTFKNRLPHPAPVVCQVEKPPFFTLSQVPFSDPLLTSQSTQMCRVPHPSLHYFLSAGRSPALLSLSSRFPILPLHEDAEYGQYAKTGDEEALAKRERKPNLIIPNLLKRERDQNRTPKQTRKTNILEINPKLHGCGGAGLSGGQLMGRRSQSQWGLDVPFFMEPNLCRKALEQKAGSTFDFPPKKR